MGLLREELALILHFLQANDSLPVSRETKRILGFAVAEAEQTKQKWIGSPHLLIGILREPASLAARILTSCGLQLDAARAYAASSE